MTHPDQSTDLLVAGGGMAGLVASLSAAEAHADVTVIEKGLEAGGAARLSAGVFWTPPTFEALRQTVPEGDEELQRTLASEFDDSLTWLKGHGLPLPSREVLTGRTGRLMGIGDPGRREGFMEALRARAEKLGVHVLTRRQLASLERVNGGFSVRITSGETVETWSARALVLATGGYQGNRELLARYLGPESDSLMIRSWPGCTGDGFLAGLAAGAGASRGLGGFYGHTMPATTVPPEEYQTITPYFASIGVLVNRFGNRFTDESFGNLEEGNAAAGMRQPGGRYYLIFDQKIYRDHVLGPGITGGDLKAPNKFERAKALGAPTLEAPNLPELVVRMEREWEVNGPRLLAELDAYNRVVREGRGALLVPPRIKNQQPLDEGPFYAMTCVGAITIPYGGLWVNGGCQVRDRSGAPIRGLYAAGADAGGVFNRTYGGGLAWALVSGRVAGRNAAKLY